MYSVKGSVAVDMRMQYINNKSREVECDILRNYVLQAGIFVTTVVSLVLVY
jgi:hypothetical protein